MADIQFVSDEVGNTVSVIVPIDLWREIEFEKETAYLLKGLKMKERLLESKKRKKESRWKKCVRNLEFDQNAFEDLA